MNFKEMIGHSINSIPVVQNLFDSVVDLINRILNDQIYLIIVWLDRN